VRVALAALLAVALAGAPSAPTAPAVGARAFVLMEARTGQVLAQRRAHLPWPPASTTKVLTALLVAESLEPEDVVTVSPRAAALREGATVGLRPGERRRVRDLLYAMLLVSANDAAVALAEAAAGSVEAFVDRMNRRARELGARESHFVNPHGLYHPRHTSTAYDLAVLARAALQHPRVAEAVATAEYEFPTESGPRKLANRNRLLVTYPGANGVKTGWVAQSGPCLVASARRGDRTLIAVVLDSKRVFEDAAALLELGFSRYDLRTLATPDRPVAEFRLEGGALVQAGVRGELLWSVPRGVPVQLRPRPQEGLKPPLPAGAPVGTLEVVVGSRVEARVPLVALHAVQVRRPEGGVLRWLQERLWGR